MCVHVGIRRVLGAVSEINPFYMLIGWISDADEEIETRRRETTRDRLSWIYAVRAAHQRLARQSEGVAR